MWETFTRVEKSFQEEFEDVKQRLNELVEKYENCVRNERHQREKVEKLLIGHQKPLKKALEDHIKLKDYIEHYEKVPWGGDTRFLTTLAVAESCCWMIEQVALEATIADGSDGGEYDNEFDGID